MFARSMRAVVFTAAIALSTGVPAEPIQLKLATFGPPQSHFYAEVVIPWMEAVNRDAGGAIEIKHFGASVLGNASNMYDVVMNGAADIGWALQGLAPSKFVQSTVVELPFGYSSGEQGSVAFWRLFEKGLIASDYKGVQLFGMTAWPPAVIQTKSKKIETLEQLKGMKLRVAGKVQADTLLGMGGTPVNVAIDEVYQAIDRGVIDGMLGSFTATRPFRVFEVARYFLDVPLNGADAMLIMSKEHFDKLPAQARAAFEKNSGEALSRALGQSNDREVGRVKDLLADLAKQGKIAPVYSLTDTELGRWKAAVEPVAKNWTQRVPNGAAILESFRAEIAALQDGR